MPFTVDTKHLLHEPFTGCKMVNTVGKLGVNRSGDQRRYQLHRICVYAIVMHDAAARAQFDVRFGNAYPRTGAALDWQAEQGDDEDEVEVLHHLKQLAATSTKPGVRPARPSGGVDSPAGTTTLCAIVQSPTFTSCTPHRPPSFRRYSFRQIVETTGRGHYYDNQTNIFHILPNLASHEYINCPKIASTDTEAQYQSVIWYMQSDFIDLSGTSPSFASSPGKRRRTLDPFHHISPRRDGQRTPRAHDHPPPGDKRFRGVRYRTDHDRWVAEMKPPKSKNKLSFGEFRSQTDAARVVDVAFHHYGRPLNFPDSTPCILDEMPLSDGLSAEEKLRAQIKWMRDILPTLQPSPSEPGFTSSTPNPSTSDTISGFRPFSAIGSSVILVGTDDADDAASQPQPGWLQALMSSAGMADGKDTSGVVHGSGEGPQSSTMQWSAETAIAHDGSNVFRSSAEHCSETLTTVVSSQPIMDVGGSMPEDFPTATPLLSTWSPGAFRVDGADGSWEQGVAVGWDELLESGPLDCDGWMMQ